MNLSRVNYLNILTFFLLFLYPVRKPLSSYEGDYKYLLYNLSRSHMELEGPENYHRTNTLTTKTFFP